MALKYVDAGKLPHPLPRKEEVMMAVEKMIETFWWRRR
jgi:hypothetical protein